MKTDLSPLRGLRRRVQARLRLGWLTDRAGVSAVEFALLSPLFCLVLVGTVDFGGMVYVKFKLTGTVSAASSYVLINAANVSSSGSPGLAKSVAGFVASNNAANWANANVVVNAGPSATVTGGVLTTGGYASSSDSCYCPTLAVPTVSWGAATTCGSPCPGGSLAGKFVTIQASRAYSPIFPSYGLVSNRTVSASAVVQTN